MALTLPTQVMCRDYDTETSHSLSQGDKATSSDFSDGKLYLPHGFPKRMKSELAWSGPQLSSDQYIYRFSEKDKIEIHAALAHFKELHIDGDLVNCHNFPLPNLSLVLRSLTSELHNGKGFFLLRGLDYDKYTVEDNTVIFLGIQSFIAEQRARQDHLGNMMVHIIADSTASSPPLRTFHTRHSKAKVSFHTDNIGDVLGFQTRSIAAWGGNAVVSSAYSIYNDLASSRPEIVQVLAEPNWPIATPYYHECPILFHYAARLIFNFSDSALLGSKAHPRPPDLPALSPAQIAALSILQDLAEKHSVSIPLQVGDMHFVNNLALLHRRDAFGIAPGKKRHLVRMCLRSEEHAWELPRVLKRECGWESAFEDNDADEHGEREELWHIEPMPSFFFPLRMYTN